MKGKLAFLRLLGKASLGLLLFLIALIHSDLYQVKYISVISLYGAAFGGSNSSAQKLLLGA